MKKIIGLVMILLFMMPAYSSALDCAVRPIEEAFDEYDAVLIADVEKVKQGNEYNKVTVKVTKSFKGTADRSITFRESRMWGVSQAGEQLEFLADKENLIKDEEEPAKTIKAPLPGEPDAQDSAQPVSAFLSDRTATILLGILAAAAAAGGIVIYRKIKSK